MKAAGQKGKLASRTVSLRIGSRRWNSLVDAPDLDPKEDTGMCTVYLLSYAYPRLC